MKYICLNCGYMFDEQKGVPEKRMAPNYNAMLKTGCGWHKNQDESAPAVGVAPGTKWQDVPEEFTCPSCGAAKDLFEA
ncbi:rubredoxin [Christensenellaceae bacterium OttesenSCG-928-K19]|nr:rubredoxin [Christensenellaceae bacterium OttesenSCG-928-K19]